MNSIPASVFATRLKELLEHQEVVFFIGAGCSISSGIPGAAELVKEHWLPRLYAGSHQQDASYDFWLQREFPTYQPSQPAHVYGDVMARLFVDDNQRQMEIERICTGKDPGFGYAALARLIALPNSRARIVLTTNFDDFMFDALYLYANARPVMISHDSLAPFIRPSHRRPIVVKVHGDHLLAPRNLLTETREIAEELKKRLIEVVRDRIVVFMGYGGDDQSISDLFAGVPPGASSYFWLKRTEPKCKMDSWIESHHVTWVQGDFDSFMLLVFNAFDLGHPSPDRFTGIFQHYLETHDELRRKIGDCPDEMPDVAAVRDAEKQVSEALPLWWKIELDARQFKTTDPEKATQIYEDGLKRLGDNPPLLTNFASFLTDVGADSTRIEELYERALAVDPLNATILGSYAVFLERTCKDYDRAEQTFERAIGTNPTDVTNLGAFAGFLTTTRQDHKRAQEIYEQAIAVDSTDNGILVRYATFLIDIRQDYDQAQELYERAVTADPTNAAVLGTFAIFLANIRNDSERAREVFDRSLTANPTDANTLGNFAGFLLAQGNEERGLLLLRIVMDQIGAADTSGLAAECWFYFYANGPASSQETALKAMRRLVDLGVHSPNWNFDRNIARARERNHPQAEWLDRLAAVINGSAEPTVLDTWKAWAKAV